MNTVLMLRPVHQRQIFGAQLPDDLTVEDSVRAVCTPLFASNPSLTAVEFRLVDQRQPDGKLSEAQRTTAANERKGNIVPAVVETIPVRSVAAQQDEPLVEFDSPSVIPFRRKTRSLPMSGDTTPPSAA